MKHKDYEKPTTRVVELQQRTMLLAGSNELTTTRDAYGTANDGVDSSETDGEGNWLWE